MLGEPLNTTIKTSAQINLTIKGTQNYTIPVGYTKMDIFCVGAGGSGAFDSDSRQGGGGGGGGYTKTVLNISVTAGQVLAVTVGAGIIYKRGGTSSVTRSGTVLCTATGGNPGSNVDGEILQKVIKVVMVVLAVLMVVIIMTPPLILVVLMVETEE